VGNRVVVFVAFALVVAGTAHAGAWFVPFLVGLLAGGLRGAVPEFPSVPVATLAAVAGWAGLLWAMALAGLPVGATARAIAGLAGLPPYAAVTVVATLLLAALQVLAGAWLARAVRPSR
jgi:hypothetical protein